MLILACIIVLVLVLTVKITGIDYLYIALLFLPFIDVKWKPPVLSIKTRQDIFFISVCLACIAILLLLQPQHLSYFFAMLLLTALPEEWFFRGYLYNRLLSRPGATGWKSNLITSVAFTALHLVANPGILAFLVLFPSLLFGWVYQKTGSIYLVILLHALSNLIFIGHLQSLLKI